MPKYFPYKVCGYYLYYTEHCILEAMHAYASDSKLTEAGSAKFFVRADGSTVVQNRGTLKDHEITKNSEVHKNSLPRNVSGLGRR